MRAVAELMDDADSLEVRHIRSFIVNMEQLVFQPKM